MANEQVRGSVKRKRGSVSASRGRKPGAAGRGGNEGNNESKDSKSAALTATNKDWNEIASRETEGLEAALDAALSQAGDGAPNDSQLRRLLEFSLDNLWTPLTCRDGKELKDLKETKSFIAIFDWLRTPTHETNSLEAAAVNNCPQTKAQQSFSLFLDGLLRHPRFSPAPRLLNDGHRPFASLKAAFSAVAAEWELSRRALERAAAKQRLPAGTSAASVANYVGYESIGSKARVLSELHKLQREKQLEKLSAAEPRGGSAAKTLSFDHGEGPGPGEGEIVKQAKEELGPADAPQVTGDLVLDFGCGSTRSTVKKELLEDERMGETPVCASRTIVKMPVHPLQKFLESATTAARQLIEDKGAKSRRAKLLVGQLLKQEETRRVGEQRKRALSEKEAKAKGKLLAQALGNYWKIAGRLALRRLKHRLALSLSRDRAERQRAWVLHAAEYTRKIEQKLLKSLAAQETERSSSDEAESESPLETESPADASSAANSTDSEVEVTADWAEQENEDARLEEMLSSSDESDSGKADQMRKLKEEADMDIESLRALYGTAQPQLSSHKGRDRLFPLSRGERRGSMNEAEDSESSVEDSEGWSEQEAEDEHFDRELREEAKLEDTTANDVQDLKLEAEMPIEQLRALYGLGPGSEIGGVSESLKAAPQAAVQDDTGDQISRKKRRIEIMDASQSARKFENERPSEASPVLVPSEYSFADKGEAFSDSSGDNAAGTGRTVLSKRAQKRLESRRHRLAARTKQRNHASPVRSSEKSSQENESENTVFGSASSHSSPSHPSVPPSTSPPLASLSPEVLIDSPVRKRQTDPEEIEEIEPRDEPRRRAKSPTRLRRYRRRKKEGTNEQTKKRRTKETDEAEDKDNYGDIPDKEQVLTQSWLLKANLRSYQAAGVRWLVSLHDNEVNGILADEMGLGKTVQSIALLCHLATERRIWGPHLVVVPSSVVINWQAEFTKFAPGLKVMVYLGSKKEREQKRKGWSKPNAFNVCITSYSLALADAAALRRINWYYMILDEAQHLKNSSSARWQTLLQYSTERRLLLTGTPLQNNLMELWSLMYFLMPEVFGSHEDWQEIFSEPLTAAVEKSKVQSEVNLIADLYRILQPFMLRRLKKNVESQMPRKIEKVLRCQLSKRQKYIYHELMEQSQESDVFQKGDYLTVMNTLMQLRKVCNHPDLLREVHTTSPLADSRWQSTRLIPAFLHFLPAYPHADNQATEQSAISRTVALSLQLSKLHEPLFAKPLMPPSPSEFALPGQEDPSQAGALNLAPFLVTADGDANKYAAAFYNRKVLKVNMNASRVISSIIAHPAVQAREKGVRAHTETLRRERALKARHESKQVVNVLEFCPGSIVRKLVAGGSEFSQNWRRSGTSNMHQIENLASELYGSRYLHAKCILEQRASFYSHENSVTFTGPGAALKSQKLAFDWQAAETAKNDLLFFESPVEHEYAVASKLRLPPKLAIERDANKMKKLTSILRNCKEEKSKVIIFTQMSKMLNILELYMNIYGFAYVRLDGTLKPEKRQAVIDRFNSDPRVLAFIASTRSGGVGINLTAANHVVFFDTDWNPAMDRQAMDRCHRLGQTKDVTVHRLITEGTVEENIWRKQLHKRILADFVVNQDTFGAEQALAFDANDVRELIFSLDTSDDLYKTRILHDSAQDASTQLTLLEGDSLTESLRNSLTDPVLQTGPSAPAAAQRPDGRRERAVRAALSQIEDQEDALALSAAQKEESKQLQEFAKEFGSLEGAGVSVSVGDTLKVSIDGGGLVSEGLKLERRTEGESGDGESLAATSDCGLTERLLTEDLGDDTKDMAPRDGTPRDGTPAASSEPHGTSTSSNVGALELERDDLFIDPVAGSITVPQLLAQCVGLLETVGRTLPMEVELVKHNEKLVAVARKKTINQ